MTGVVIAVLPERSGTSQRGEWKSQSFVIETQEQYPKHLCFEVFGADRIAQFNIKGGETITVQFDIDARQYQDRWFNSIKAWNVIRPGQHAHVQGFSKPARSCKKIHLAPILQKFLDQLCFIYIIEPILPDFFEVIKSDRQSFRSCHTLHAPSRHCTSLPILHISDILVFNDTISLLE